MRLLRWTTSPLPIPLTISFVSIVALTAAAASAQPAGHEQMHHGAHSEPHVMPALLGPYNATREASGTAWQPASSEHEAIHKMAGSWSVMFHGFATAVGDHQGGDRGDDEIFAASMVLAGAARPVGPGRFGLRTMLSLDPATIGKDGYPLLLQTGETGDGATPLIDRQHPHDFFMELAASYSVSSGNRSVFLYAGLPGEPALGPPVFMHRRSGVEIPEAPIAHHWLDSSHITFGVVTLGAVQGSWKAEGSAFRGREPNPDRWDVEKPDLDSYAFRLSWNPTQNWALQGSFGRLESPEELHPDVDTDRYTASAIYNRAAGGRNWQTTLAWGRNRNRPGRTLDAFILESTLSVRSRHTFMGRAEVAEKDELFEEGDPLGDRAYTVKKIGVGYVYDPLLRPHLAVGVGAYGTVSVVPEAIVAACESEPLSGMIFLRAKIR
jgi:hypothetical protein